VGPEVRGIRAGDRVCVHYMVTCGTCDFCRGGTEQFCRQGSMIGKNRDGGYAEYIVVPERNAVPLPEAISFEAGAVMMCSSATSYHALRKARLTDGDTVAVFGAGGLGISAVQLARILGAAAVYAVDIDPQKLRLAEASGAVPVDATAVDPVAAIRRLTDGRGVDVALELIGLPLTMEQAVRCLAVFGRAALVGITGKPFSVRSYTELIGREAEIVGVSDHLLSELPQLIELARRGDLDLANVVTRRVPLEAEAINAALDDLERCKGGVRTVIVPE
jgi:propanol-preferring alcohol dehydrogenase